MSVHKKVFDDNWEKIFGKKDLVCEYSGLPNTDTYIVDKLTELSQEIGLYDAPKRSEDNQREFPRIDEDGVPIEWTAC